MYNPINDRINNLMNQRQAIENQIASLQQMANVPPININNQITPNTNPNDFNARWVNNEQEARNMMITTPSIFLDRNDSLFYMKTPDGSFKKYRFTEEQQSDSVEQRITRLETILSDFINKSNTNTKATKETPRKA